MPEDTQDKGTWTRVPAPTPVPTASRTKRTPMRGQAAAGPAPQAAAPPSLAGHSGSSCLSSAAPVAPWPGARGQAPAHPLGPLLRFPAEPLPRQTRQPTPGSCTAQPLLPPGFGVSPSERPSLPPLRAHQGYLLRPGSRATSSRKPPQSPAPPAQGAQPFPQGRPRPHLSCPIEPRRTPERVCSR